MESVSPRCRLHRSPGGSSSRAAPGADAAGHSRTAHGLFKFRMDVSSEMESQADVAAAAVDLVDDVDAARGPVEQHRAAVQSRRIKRGVPVMFSCPSGNVTVIEHLDLAGMRMTHPHEEPAVAELPPAAGSGVPPRTPGTRVSQDVDAREAHLDGQRIGAGVRDDAAGTRAEPPSHRHQISFSPRVRSSVIPASAKREGRWLGLPSIWRLLPARAPTIGLTALAGVRGHQSCRPTSASARASMDGGDSAPARQARVRGFHRNHPGGADATAHRQAPPRYRPEHTVGPSSAGRSG